MRMNWRKVAFVAAPVLVLVVVFCIWKNMGTIEPRWSTKVYTDKDFDFKSKKPRKEWKDQYSRQAVDRSSLEENGVLITNNIYSQIFTPYAKTWNKPLFITSDSLLNAYHVLYEETVFQMECEHAEQLPEALWSVLENLDHAESKFKSDKAVISRAKERALLVVGIALKLMDDSFEVNGFRLNRILNDEVRKIREGNARGLPKWLGESGPSLIALDYSRYRPRGFYTRAEYLSRYFQAVSWLQSIPFRVDHDEELAAILMLGASASDSESDQFNSFFRSYEDYIGSCDDLDLVTASELDFDVIDLSGEGLDAIREQIVQVEQQSIGRSLINDQIRLLPDNQSEYGEIDFRVISGYRTPSAILFQRTTDRRHFNCPFPNGLEITAALGSSFALDLFDESEDGELGKVIQSCEEYFKGESLDAEYLGALSELLNEPEKGAPEFMKKEGWKRKSCQTVLGSWAQKRHTFALQAKQSVYYESAGPDRPAGFVEPDPEFFAKMLKLVQRTKSQLMEDGLFDRQATKANDDQEFDMEKLWGSLELICEDLERISRKQLKGEEFSGRDNSIIEYYGERLAKVMLYDGDSYHDPVDEAPKIIDVFANPEGGGYLHAGISRARGMYVLYPWKGETYLCYGAIMPYHEFVSPKRLTDEDWMEMLDSEEPPSMPTWMDPINSRAILSE